MVYVNVEAIRALDEEELRRALREDAMPAEQYVAMRAELDRRLADALHEAEANHKGGESDDILTAENAIIDRLNLPLDQTEQGLTAWASEQIIEFVEIHRTK